jgi:hypothetical protein
LLFHLAYSLFIYIIVVVLKHFLELKVVYKLVIYVFYSFIGIVLKLMQSFLHQLTLIKVINERKRRQWGVELELLQANPVKFFEPHMRLDFVGAVHTESELGVTS